MFELPCLEEIEQMERERSQAIESLEISNDSNYVKCQSCNKAVPIVGKLIHRSDRIAVLQRRLNWLEHHQRYINHHRGYRGAGGGSSNNDNDDNVKQLKQELAELQEEDAKADKLRHLPLYSCRITGFRFVSSRCYDKAYMLMRRS